MKKLINMQIKISKKSFCAIALAFIVFSVLGITPINAESRGASNKRPCSRVGTWLGEVEEDEGMHPLTFMSAYTPGQDATSGQVTVQWVDIDPTFGVPAPPFIYAVRVTNSYGVWKKVNHRMYQFTWISHGFDENGEVVYTVRSSGYGEILDCDDVNITFVLEIWYGNADIYTEEPVYTSPPGAAFEKRIPLVQASAE